MTAYSTIVADPPWKYTGTRQHSDNGDRRGAPAEARYDTLTMAAICEIPVASIVADEAHLYLWATNPRLFQGYRNDPLGAFDVMKAWGFTYQTMLTWVKTGAPGLGFYFRGATEHVLFGTRGKLGIAPALRKPNVFTAPRGRHSSKPDVFFELVEQVSPGPYVELFSRRERDGWDSWGHESAGTAEMAA